MIMPFRWGREPESTRRLAKGCGTMRDGIVSPRVSTGSSHFSALAMSLEGFRRNLNPRSDAFEPPVGRVGQRCQERNVSTTLTHLVLEFTVVRSLSSCSFSYCLMIFPSPGKEAVLRLSLQAASPACRWPPAVDHFGGQKCATLSSEEAAALRAPISFGDQLLRPRRRSLNPPWQPHTYERDFVNSENL